MDALEAFKAQFGPVKKDAKVFVKSNFEILTTPEKISKPKRRPQVRPEYIYPQDNPLKKVYAKRKAVNK